ncbi:MAG: hypothetical protein WC558_00875 [Patulibacter sp.]
MGLKDWLTKKAMARLPDHRAIVQAHLGAEDEVRGHAFGYPVAYERGGRHGPNKLLSKAIDTATNAVQQGRHVGGPADGIAASLPLDSQAQTMLVLSARTFSGWTFGVMNNDEEPEQAFRVPRSDVRSIERTGKTRQGGTIEIRITFADGSFVDWQVLDQEMMCVGFWEAAEALASPTA